MVTHYLGLKNAFDGYLAGSVSAEELKPVAAAFGIYQQRNGSFMVRIRVNGGEISCKWLEGVADVLASVGGYAHLTSRQDIQLHDVPAAEVLNAVTAVECLGLPFRGGGGNTYRNIAVGADSGLSPETVFDVYPYAQLANAALLAEDKALSLPRKFKIGFFAGEGDVLRAAINDLGFVAQVRDGVRGFRVYAGGGLGRESRVGICLEEFLPAGQMLRAVLAMVALFHDHGNRENRHQARLRFLLKDRGEEAFVALYRRYFDATAAADGKGVPPETALPEGFAAGQEAAAAESEGFGCWRAHAVWPTRFGEDVVSVRLYVPYGNLSAVQMRKIARLASEAGSPFVRLLTTQDVLVPFVAVSGLTRLYARLLAELGDVDLTFRSYKGHILTCVGASVCKIGMVDAPAVADRIAEALDAYLPPDTPEKLACLKRVADEVRISGCPNSCAAHPAVRFGVGCVNRRVEGVVRPYAQVLTGAGVVDGVPRISTPGEGAEPVPVEALPEILLGLVAGGDVTA